MSALRPLMPTGRAARVLDLVLAMWVAVWISIGLAISHQVSGLRQLSGTVTQVGSAITETGDALSAVGAVPLVGGRVDELATDVRAAGQSTVASGRHSRDSVHTLSWMLGLAIAVIPSVPIAGFYVPLRVAEVRERRSLRRLLARRPFDDDLERELALRAVATMPYRRLLAIEHDPWGAVAGGRCERLARAELERHGLTAIAAARRPAVH
jgi:hypothetical protein